MKTTLLLLAGMLAACERRTEPAPAAAEPADSATVADPLPPPAWPADARFLGAPPPPVDLAALARAPRATTPDATAIGSTVDVYLIGEYGGADDDPMQTELGRPIQPWLVLVGSQGTLRFALEPALVIADPELAARTLEHAPPLADPRPYRKDDAFLSELFRGDYPGSRMPSKAPVLVGASYGAGAETWGTTRYVVTHDGDELVVWWSELVWEEYESKTWKQILSVRLPPGATVRAPPTKGTSLDLEQLVALAAEVPRDRPIDAAPLGDVLDTYLILSFSEHVPEQDRPVQPWLVIGGTKGSVRVRLNATKQELYSFDPDVSIEQRPPYGGARGPTPPLPAHAILVDSIGTTSAMDVWVVVHANDQLLVQRALADRWETWATLDLAPGATVRTPFGIVAAP